MKREKRRPKKLNLLVFSVVTLSLSLGIWFVTSVQLQSNESEKKAGADQINVTNNVDALEVVSSNISGSKFVVSVRNKSQKAINGFYVASGKEAWQVELIYSELRDSVEPSADFDISLPLSATLYKYGVSVRAVLFDNNTGTGEPEFTKLMLDRRQGEKQELRKGKLVLEESNFDATKSREKLQQVKEKFRSTESENTDQNESVKLGIHLGRQRFLQAIEELERTSEEKPAKVDFEYKRLVAKLQKYLLKL